MQVLGVLKKCSSERSEARQAITAERGGWSGISSLRHHCQGELDAGTARPSFAVAAAETFQQPFLFERMAFTDPFSGMAGSREPRWLKDVRVRAVAAVLLAAVALVTIAWSFPVDALPPTPNAGDARLQPSGEGLPFDPGRFRDFDDYLTQTRDRIGRYKMYVDPRRKGTELAAATPFELPPADGCAQAESARPRRGIVLLHGLADLPLAMRDLAGAFAARCFLVRVMLLPGHRARAGDLLTVTRGD